MRPTMIAVSLLVGLTQPLSTPARADNPRPVVVELYTSQGCSSCPPADALLTELARDPHILPLAFHVTYWNNLGWRDPFSLDVATDRQRSYQRQLHSDTIYTPQMVVDGQTDVIGSDRAAVAAAIAHARPASPIAITLERTAGGVSVQIPAGPLPDKTLPDGNRPGAQAQPRILLIGYDAAHRTTVSRGENAGRQLAETNIVRAIAVVGSWSGDAIRLSQPLPPGDRTAVLLQAADGHILGAAVLARPQS